MNTNRLKIMCLAQAIGIIILLSMCLQYKLSGDMAREKLKDLEENYIYDYVGTKSEEPVLIGPDEDPNPLCLPAKPNGAPKQNNSAEFYNEQGRQGAKLWKDDSQPYLTPKFP